MKASAATAAELIRAQDRPVLVLGGGGYDPPRTARGWALCWATLCNLESEDERARIDAEVDRVIAFHEAHTLPLLAPGTR